LNDLDQPARIADLRALIERKPFLRRLYLEIYGRYAACLARCPVGGEAVELGSGAGFVKALLPEVVTSDVLPYPGMDRVVDGTRMPFPDGGLRALFLLNVFHHIADPVAFLREAERCLAPGGRLLIVDQHPGTLSTPIFRHLHHEPFRPEATEWAFETTGPLSGANGALAWMVFRRDAERFKALFPGLALERYQPHTPLRYWLAGGLKAWSLAPGWAFPLATWLDRALVGLSDRLASFVDVELVRRATAPSPVAGAPTGERS
jgi:SAM-dependent methyltransferase